MSFPAQYAADPGRARPRRDGDATREKVVQTAAETLSAIGFNKMSIASVAERAGVSQSGLLHHFPSKSALLLAVLERRGQEDTDFLFSGDDVPLGWDAFEALVGLTARNASRPELVELFVRTSAEATVVGHPAHEWLEKHYASMRTWLSDAVEHGQATGQIVNDAPVALIVDTTIAVIDGIQQQWILDRDNVSMIDCVRHHVSGLQSQWGTKP